MQADAVAAALLQAYRYEWASALSATVRVAGDLDVAEGRAEEEYVSALLNFVVVIALIAMGGVLILADNFNPVSFF